MSIATDTSSTRSARTGQALDITGHITINLTGIATMTVEHRGTRPALGQSVHTWSLPYLVSWVERQGTDVSLLQRLPGMSAVDDPDARIPEHVVEAAWRLAATLTRHGAIGIEVAESLPRGALDLVEYAFRSSPSLGVGLDRLARY